MSIDIPAYDDHTIPKQVYRHGFHNYISTSHDFVTIVIIRQLLVSIGIVTSHCRGDQHLSATHLAGAL